MNTALKERPELDGALAAAEARFAAANPKSRAQHERAAAVLPAGHSRLPWAEFKVSSPATTTISRLAVSNEVAIWWLGGAE